jgi:hypothetical protein
MTEIVQGSPEWKALRCGRVTASRVADVVARTKTGYSASRANYLAQLIAERLTGTPAESYTNAAMQHGTETEPEARWIGEDGGLEIKTKLPHLLIELIFKNEFPSEHKAQVQGTLWITKREWWDLTVYWRGIPQFTKRAYRDEGYIANLAGAVNAFNEELDQVVKTIRAHGGENTLASDLQKSAAAA